jgi:sugar fermentation stimulation protein A
MDSQVPNKVVAEWILDSAYFGEVKLLRPEFTYGSSRFDFYLETADEKILIEVKGVTLENDGVVSFPDAPTERGIKHLRELVAASKNGFCTYVIFVVQMREAKYFTPNEEKHPAFAEALREAVKSGVKPLALTCRVSEDSINAEKFIEIRL